MMDKVVRASCSRLTSSERDARTTQNLNYQINCVTVIDRVAIA